MSNPTASLYNMAAENEALAQTIAEAVAGIDPQLLLVILAGKQRPAHAGSAAPPPVCGCCSKLFRTVLTRRKAPWCRGTSRARSSRILQSWRNGP
jgi:hypothetical protein